MRVQNGDTVVVISGKDKGKTGTVMRVLKSTDRVVVEGINMRTRHIRKTPQQAGQKIRYEASIHASNVMPIDAKTKKRTRVRMEMDSKTKAKKRVAVRSGEVIAKVTPKKTVKADTKETAKVTEKKKTTSSSKK